jgi:hypothetical protein
MTEQEAQLYFKEAKERYIKRFLFENRATIEVELSNSANDMGLNLNTMTDNIIIIKNVGILC